MMVPARAEHVAFVFARLSDQTKAEMEAVGWNEDRLLDEYLAFMERGESFAYLDHGTAGCLVAFAPGGEATLTFLIGAKGFFENSVAHRHELRRFMAAQVQRHGLIATLSSSPDPNLSRWMAMLGAIEATAESGEKIFLWT